MTTPKLDLAQFNGFTPGPWKADPRRVIIQTPTGYREGPIMSYLCGSPATWPGMTVSIASERHVDHYLCAAAPSLLAECRRLQADNARLREALENILGWMEQHHPVAFENCQKARAALQGGD